LSKTSPNNPAIANLFARKEAQLFYWSLAPMLSNKKLLDPGYTGATLKTDSEPGRDRNQRIERWLRKQKVIDNFARLVSQATGVLTMPTPTRRCSLG
jgi:hypothetical protein